MTTPETLDLDLNVRGYVAGAQTALVASNSLNDRLGALGATAIGLNKVMSSVTPGRAFAASIAGVTAVAAANQQAMSQLAATAKITGANFRQISSGVNDLARAFPIGQGGARQMYETLSQVGVAGKGAEGQLKALSKTFVQLSGATGEGLGSLTASMVQLDRAFGGGNVSPKRVAAMADSLVTVSKQSGASASSIASFTQSLAPMAKAAGIGQNATMGISAAFARMGEDGVGASTAMNKILTDLNKSVRTGSSEMNTYASIVGMTATNFEKLFKANPAETLVKITEAISAAGPGGPRILEQLGLDGVRTQRQLQGLSASGGLRASINQAIGGTGSGNTEKAAKTAFGGLNDSLIKLGTTTTQLAEAMGRPLLGAVTKFVDALSQPINFARKAADSDIGQKFLKTGYALTALGLAAGALASKLLLAAFGQQVATSNVPRSLVAGLRGRDAPAGIGVPRSPDSRVSRAYARASQGAFNLGSGLRTRTAGITGPGMSWRDRGAILVRAPLLAAQIYGQMATDPARQMMTARQRRDSVPQAFGRQWRAALDAFRSGSNPAQSFRAANEAMSKFNRETAVMSGRVGGLGTGLAGVSTRFATLNRVINTTGVRVGQFTNFAAGRGAPTSIIGMGAQVGAQMLGAPLRYGAGVAASGIGLAARGATALGRAAGGPLGIGIAGLSIGALMYQRSKGKEKEEIERVKSGDVYSTLNAYLVSMGKATEATQTLADSLRLATASTSTSITEFGAAMSITDEDRKASQLDANKITRRYDKASSAEEVAAQISAENYKIGLTPDVLNQVQIDLLKQFDSKKVEEITALVAKSNIQQTGARPELTGDLMSSLVSAGITAAGPDAYGAGKQDQERNPNKPAGSDTIGKWMSGLEAPIGFVTGGAFKPGAKMGKKVDEDTKAAVGAITKSIAQQTAAQGELYGADYVEANTFKAMNQAVAEAIKQGAPDAFIAQLTQELTTGLDNRRTYRYDDFKDGKSFTQVHAENEKGFANRYTNIGGEEGINRSRPAMERLTGEALTLEKFGSMGDLFNRTAGFSDRTGNKAVGASLEKVGNVDAFNKAVDQLIVAGRKAGDSFSEVSTKAFEMANALGSNSDTYKMLLAASDRANEARGSTSYERTTTQGIVGDSRAGQRILRLEANDETVANRQQQERSGVLARGNQAGQQLAQYLQQMRENQVQRERMTRDFNISVAHANEDFRIGQERGERDYQFSIFRSERDYNRQRKIANYDFNLSRKQATFDYQLSVKRSTEAFNRQQMYAQKDFDRSMVRLAEDTANSMYDPYQRIQTQAVWDAQNLLGNLQEQAAAMAKQRQNLGSLRGMGVDQSVIDMLGLDKAENAQQLDMFLSDLINDPTLIAKFEKQAKEKLKLGKAFATDKGSKDYRRALEDYTTSMDISAEQFRISLEQQDADFQRSMDRGAKLYARQLKISKQQFDTAMSDAALNYQIAVDQANSDFAKQQARQATAYQTALSDMSEDVNRANEQIVGDLEDLASAAMKTMNGEADAWIGLVKNNMFEFIKAIESDIAPAMKNALSSMGGGPGASAPTGFAGSPGKGALPVKGPYRISQGFGNVPTGDAKGFYKSGSHSGVDYAVPTGTKIYATYNGEVKEAGGHAVWGNYVLLDHGGGRTTRYGHMSSLDVKRGQEVSSGDLLGLSGSTGKSTGPHLHYETSVNGKAVNPNTVKWNAKGGVFTGPQIIGVGEAGDEAVIPLDNRGMSLIAAAMNKYATTDALRGRMTGQYAEGVVYRVDSINYDHRNDFSDAKITVMAADPDEMARKLEARQRRSNLTKTKVGR